MHVWVCSMASPAVPAQVNANMKARTTPAGYHQGTCWSVAFLRLVLFLQSTAEACETTHDWEGRSDGESDVHRRCGDDNTMLGWAQGGQKCTTKGQPFVDATFDPTLRRCSVQQHEGSERRAR